MRRRGMSRHLGLHNHLTRPIPVRRDWGSSTCGPEPLPFEERENLAPVRDEENEVNGSPSYLRSTSPRPGEVRRHQAMPTVGCCMDDQPRSVPVSIQDGRRNVGGYDDVLAQWPKCVCTVHDNVAHSEWFRGAARTEALVSRPVELISQLRDLHPAESLGRFIHRVVGSESTSKQVTHQRPRSGLSISYKVGEHVTHLPARTPGRFVPRCLVQGHNAVGKLVT
jgi:hypothetical protein